MQLVGNRVVLRPIEKSDTDLIVAWRNNPLVRGNFIFQEPFTPEMHLRWMDERVATGQVAQFIIEREGAPVGSVFLRDIDPTHQKGEFGIFIGEDAARGQGLGTEAARLMLGYGFGRLGLHKIFLRVLAGNTGAIKSYENAGFVQEAYLRDDVFLNGKFCDLVLMAIRKGEFEP